MVRLWSAQCSPGSSMIMSGSSISQGLRKLEVHVAHFMFSIFGNLLLNSLTDDPFPPQSFTTSLSLDSCFTLAVLAKSQDSAS